MTTKLVCRLLDANGALLGWTELYAKARGDGKLWSQAAVLIAPEVSGTSAVLSVHWVDVNVETRVPCVRTCAPGMVIAVYEFPCPLITVGPAASGLPAVTVRSRAVGIPAGQLGARSR